VLAEMSKTSQHVAVPAFRNHLLDYDASRVARACRVPIAYIAASNLMADLGQFKQLCPQLVTAQTIGSGHFLCWKYPNRSMRCWKDCKDIFAAGSRSRGFCFSRWQFVKPGPT